MRAIVRLVIVVTASLAMLAGAASAASARDLSDNYEFGPCPPGTSHRILFVCFG
jgi:hypothetical protein